MGSYGWGRSVPYLWVDKRRGNRQSWRRSGFSNSGRIREVERVGFQVTWRVVPSSWRKSLPRSGIGQEGMTRNGWEKRKPSRLQLNRGFCHGRDGVLSTPMTEIWEGLRGPEKDDETE